MVAASICGATLATSGTGYLLAYRLSARLWGASPQRAVSMLQHWGGFACRRLHLDLERDGMPPPGPYLYVSNHRSYLDILVLARTVGTSFVSRADIIDWPLVGAVAQAIDCVFVDRDDPYGRVRAARAVRRRLAQGNLVLFPEGTTTGLPLPGPFQPGPFRLAHRLALPIVPVTLRYSDPAAYWVDDVSLWEHLRRWIRRGQRLRTAVHFGRPLVTSSAAGPEQLAQAVYEAVCEPIRAHGEFV